MTTHLIHDLLPCTHGAAVTAVVGGEPVRIHLTAEGWRTAPAPGAPSRPVDVEQITSFASVIGDTVTQYTVHRDVHVTAEIFRTGAP